MNAALFREFGGPEKIEWGEAPDRPPQKGEVVVRVRACALNRLDAWVLKGIPAYKITPPHAPGSDVAGTVEQVGSGVSGWKSGDDVILYPVISCGTCAECKAGTEQLCQTKKVVGASPVWGGYAQYVTVPASILHRKPASLPFDQAAAIPITFITAWRMLVTLAGLKSGQTVLLMGAGSGVSTAGLSIARHLGAVTIAAATTEERRKRAMALGADHTVNSADPEFWKTVRDLTGGAGVDVALEHVGPAVFKPALQSLRSGGTLVTCGATTGPEAPLDLRYLFSRQLTVRGNYIGTPRELDAVLGLFEQNRLAVTLDETFPAKEARQALERLLSGRAFGKIVLSHET